MSASEPNQSGASQKAQPSVPGNRPPNGEESEEQSLVRMYMKLTGDSESQARSVLMFVDPEKEKPNTPRPDK